MEHHGKFFFALKNETEMEAIIQYNNSIGNYSNKVKELYSLSQIFGLGPQSLKFEKE